MLYQQKHTFVNIFYNYAYREKGEKSSKKLHVYIQKLVKANNSE